VGLSAAVLNLPFLAYMTRREGVPFAVAATLYHQLYYIYSSAVYGYCRIEAMIAGRLFKSPAGGDEAPGTWR
jgi:hypothetical protein